MHIYVFAGAKLDTDAGYWLLVTGMSLRNGKVSGNYNYLLPRGK